ncbi:MAG: PorT family protein [Alistipes sp.]|nr:PorT family protein [Alistipes sp.]MBQ8438415.1 PorT family protein [Alistipes sp.]MBR3775569.1 PorT family protein [Alistipes sp.]MBR6759901.1 PorT family protein [Alistipes sp.]
MKKFLPLFLVALVATATVSAQGLRYGITGAMNVANYAMEVEGISFNPDSRIGFRAGFRMEMDAPFIYDGFYFDAEALLSAKGAKFDSSSGEDAASVISRPYYLEIPIHIGYRYMFGQGNVGIFGSFGPYFGVGLFGTNKVTVAGVESKPDAFSSDGLKRFDFGLGLRAGVAMFEHYRIYVGYDWGLIDVAKSGGNKINNRNFYVGASYMF